MRTARALASVVLCVSALTTLVAAEATTVQPTPAAVTWLVFVDDLHLSFTEPGRIRRVLRAALDALVLDGDHIVVRSSGPSSLRVHLAEVSGYVDRERIRDVVKRTTGNALKASDIAASGREPRYRARVTRDTLRELVDEAVPIRRPTAILYLSHGYSEGTADLSALSEQAERAGAAIFPLDPRAEPRDPTDRHWLVTRDSLRELANATAGTWQDTGEELETFLARITAAVRP